MTKPITMLGVHGETIEVVRLVRDERAVSLWYNVDGRPGVYRASIIGGDVAGALARAADGVCETGNPR